ncbi:MAG: hydrogenase iron-sulfur subunit [Candidatus Electrothrix sp. YB6]
MSAFQPKILYFLCGWSYPAAAYPAGTDRYQHLANLRTIRMLCTDGPDPSFPLEGLANGADAVVVGSVYPDECHSADRNDHALISVCLVHAVLDRLGVNRQRFLVDWTLAAEGQNFFRSIAQFAGKAAELGPLGKAEGMDQVELREKLKDAAETARSLKVCAALTNSNSNRSYAVENRKRSCYNRFAC